MKEKSNVNTYCDKNKQNTDYLYNNKFFSDIVFFLHTEIAIIIVTRLKNIIANIKSPAASYNSELYIYSTLFPQNGQKALSSGIVFLQFLQVFGFMTSAPHHRQ